jgi:hypothetical protein
MKASAVLCFVVGLALALSAVPATAAHMASAVIGNYGVYYPVIGGGAIFTLTVKNSAASTHAINKVVLDFEASGFKVVWANGAGWSASNTDTTCTFEAEAQPLITPGNTRMFSTKVTLPWSIAQYDLLVTTTDSVGASASFRTGNKVNVSYSSGGNADAVDLFHASSTPTANTLLALGGDAKHDGAILRNGTVAGSALADAAVTADKLALGSVGPLHIAAGAVTNAKIAADAVTDDKIPNLWRSVNLPIMGSQFLYGAVISPDWQVPGVDFPVQVGPAPRFGMTIEMPADWDPVADPNPYVELVWFADDTVANRGKTVRWMLYYVRLTVGQSYPFGFYPQEFLGHSDPSNAWVVQTTGAGLVMSGAGSKPESPGDLVLINVIRGAAAPPGTDLPDDVHLLAARLVYYARR